MWLSTLDQQTLAIVKVFNLQILMKFLKGKDLNTMYSLSLNRKNRKKLKGLPLVDKIISFCFCVLFLSQNCPVLLL